MNHRIQAICVIGLVVASIASYGYAAERDLGKQLVQAIRDENKNVLQKALDQGVDVNGKGQAGITPLMLAVAMGDESIVKILLDNNAHVCSQSDTGSTAIMEAATRNQPEIMSLLLDSVINADVKTAPANNPQNTKWVGWTALMIAAERGHIKPVQLLIGSGADTMVKNKDGDTALDIAQCNKHKDVVRLLDMVAKKTSCDKNLKRS